MCYPNSSSLSLFVRWCLSLNVNGRKSLTVRLMYPLKLGKTQNKFVQNNHWYCSKWWQAVSRRKGEIIVVDLKIKGNFSPALKIWTKINLFFFFLQFCLWNFSQWNWMHLFQCCFGMLLYFLGLIFNKMSIKHLACLMMSIIFCLIKIFSLF